MADVNETTRNKECGYCLQPLRDLLTAKLLPCGHVHCLTCLNGAYSQKVISCPHCKVACTKIPETLAELDIATGAVKQFCGHCSPPKQAIRYCLECRKKLCNEHDQVHKEHSVVPISEYTIKGQGQLTRICTRHKDQVLRLCCVVCGTPFCNACLENPEECSDGGSHCVETVESTIATKKRMVEKTFQKIQKKTEALQLCYKLTSRAVTQFDEDTEEMLNSLNAEKEKQVKDLIAQFDLLKHHLMESRQEVRDKLTSFKDDSIEVQWGHLTDFAKQFEARASDLHQPDMKKWTDLEDSTYSLALKAVPTLCIPMVLQLSLKDNYKRTKIPPGTSLTHAPNIEIAAQEIEYPTTMTFLNEVAVTDSCFSVCNNSNIVYVGQSNCKGIDRIFNQNKLLPSFLPLDGPVWSLAADESGNVYSLISKGCTWEVQICTRLGEVVGSWELGYTENRNKRFTDPSKDRGATGLAYVGGYIVIPDVTSQSISVYNKTGGLVYSISSYFGSSDAAICALDGSSVIVTARQSLKVFRMNIETKQRIWTYGCSQEPGGVACYNNKYVLVSPAYSRQTSITVLDASSGRVVRRLIDTVKRCPSWIYNISIAGDTLIIPRCNQGVVLFYDLD